MTTELQIHSRGESRTPLLAEVPYVEPAAAFAPLAHEPFAQLLDSTLTTPGTGRYAFVLARPTQTLTARGNLVSLNGRRQVGDPFAAIEEMLGPFTTPARNREPHLPPFLGGVCGYFGYDLCHHLEKLPHHRIDDLGFPDMCLGLYDSGLAFDKLERRTWAFSADRNTSALSAWEAIARETPPTLPPPENPPHFDFHSNFTRDQYEAEVRRTIEYIFAGDIYQANISQRFLANTPPSTDLFEVYRYLSALLPAPFSAYLNFDGTQIASLSPERFLSVTPQDSAYHVETRPIKGTRPRGATTTEDQALMRELLESEKDQAENAMIVDLLRNDLSRVCALHSVEVTDLFTLESFANVHHLVSAITGRLTPNFNAIDLLKACFPGGSITGAPKIRAMEIIAELETVSRGPYCGAIGYVGYDGAMDTSITIRTLCSRGGQTCFQVGGGIVADSDPAMEYDETLAKGKVFLDGLGTHRDKTIPLKGAVPA